MPSFRFQHIIKRRRDREPQLLSTDGSEGLPLSGAGCIEQAEVNDLSYRDALFDAHLRHTLHAELGNVEPSQNAFNNLMHRIKTDASIAATPKRTVRSRPSLGLSHVAGVLRSVLTGPTLARVVSGGLALMLLVSLPGVNVSRRLLGGTELTYMSTSSHPAPKAEIAFRPFDRVAHKFRGPSFDFDTNNTKAPIWRMEVLPIYEFERGIWPKQDQPNNQRYDNGVSGRV